MKRIYLIVFLLLCSCGLNDSFSKTCIYEVKNPYFSEKTTMKIIYSGNDLIESAVIIKNYKSVNSDDIVSDIKSSISEYNNKYGGSGIKYSINKNLDDEYEIEYFIPVKSVDENVLNDFKLQKNSVKLFKSLKKENIECEG